MARDPLLTEAPAPSGAQFELELRDQRAVVVEIGGGLREYSAAGRPVLDGYAERELCSSGRGQLLIPWPNRIGDGRYEFDGRTLQLPLDEPERRNAIHGLVRWSSWRLADRTQDRVALEHVLRPQPGYPFTLALRVEYALDGDGLTVRTDATNLGAETCPYGAGAHPYLALTGGSVNDVTLQVPARTVLESDRRGLPVAARSVESTVLDFRAPKRVGGVRLDHCFTDLEREEGGRVYVQVGDDAVLWADASYAFMMIFTGDGLPDVDRRSLAVEPMTCAPDAFRTGNGVIRLEPGATHTAVWGIRPGLAPP